MKVDVVCRLFMVTTNTSDLVKMSHNLPKFSRQYLDKKMNDYLLFYEHDSLAKHKITILANGCHVLDIFSSHLNSYSNISLCERSRNAQCQVRAHQLVYFLFTKEVPPQNHDISHLCHNKSCINFSHLSLEPHSTNQQRMTCKTYSRGPKTSKCIGHQQYPDCIL